MGCDIHAIIEIKQNGKWRYVEDLPDAFTDRNYAFFSMLNRNVRNNYGLHGFEGKGLPSDLSGQQFRFYSEKASLENGYSRTTFCCFVNEYNFYSIFDERLERVIDMELFEHLSDGMTTDESLRYYYPRHRIRDKNTEYIVQDASLVNGQFLHVPNSLLYRDLVTYNEAYYNYRYVSEQNDFGYFEVDFNSIDYHSHSHLTLTELLSKKKNINLKEQYKIPRNFFNVLLDEIGELPECFHLIDNDSAEDTVIIGYSDDADIFWIQEYYNNAVASLIDIKEKYGIRNADDFRIVFAFDS